MKHLYYFMTLLFLSSGISATPSPTNPVHSSAFIENKGQIVDQFGRPNNDVKYMFNMAGMNVQLKANGFSYDTYHHIGGAKQEIAYHRVDIELVGANAQARLIGEAESAGPINFMNADNATQITGIRSFERVVYKEIYPGIDLVFERSESKDKNVEYNFVVHPGADPSLIKLKYIGANATSLSNEKINISVANGDFTESIPASFLVSEYSGKVSPVKQKNSETLVASYKKSGANTYAFSMPSYDTQKTLIIDPTPTLEWGTYYDGSNSNANISNGENGQAVVYDGAGNVYMTGYTTASQNISTSGAHQFIIGANSVDAFVVKFNSSGVRQWATYYGGNNDDFSTNISIDASGNIYVCGYTGSPTQIASGGAHQTAFGGITGDQDAFVVKFNSNGVRQWATYYGGSSPDRAYGVATDASGNVFLTGSTNSSSAISTAGSHQAAYGTNQDAFLVMFNSSGVRQWGTYYGGSGNDAANEVAVDGNGDIYITGTTGSNGTVIATAGAFQTSSGQGFLAKFNVSGVRQWGTFINANLQALAIDPSNNIYITGGTYTNSNIATAGTHQTSITGGYDAIIMKFTSAGSRVWGTYYGGSAYDDIYDIAFGNNNNVYIIGMTTSDYHTSLISDCAYKTVPYHIKNTVQLGNYDGYYYYTNILIAKFDAMAGTRKWGTFFAGNGPYSDYGNGIAVANNATADFYIAGQSHASFGTFNEITHGAVDSVINYFYYSGAAIFAKFNEGSIPSEVNPLPAPSNAINAFPGTTVCSGLPVTLSMTTGTLSPGAAWKWYEYTSSDIPSTLSPIGTGTSVVVTNTIVGTKTYLIRSENSCGKSACRFITIQTNPNPDEPFLSDSTYACQGASLYLYSNGASNTTPYYTWSGPAGFSSNTQGVIVTNTTTLAHAGWYRVTNTNSYGCEKKDSTYVRVKDSLNVTYTSAITICQGDSINLRSTSSLAGSSFQWKMPYTQTQNYGAGPSNVYVSSTYTYNTTHYEYTIISQINNPGNYWWYDYSGTYTLTVQNSGCQKTFTVPVVVRTAPTASLTTPANMPYSGDYGRYMACENTSYSYSATPVAGGSYTWVATGATSSVSVTAFTQNATFTTNVRGGYYPQVSYTVTDAVGCKNKASVDLYVFSNNILLSDTIRPCVGTSFNFSNYYSSPTYTWTGPGGYSSNAVNPSFTNANSAVHDGKYMAIIKTNNYYNDINWDPQQLSCYNKDSVRVIVKAAPTATINSTSPVCLYAPLTFSSTSAPFVSNYNYSWSSAHISASGQSVTVNPYTAETTTVTLTMTDNFGCVGTATTMVTINPLPNVGVTNNSPICEGDTIRLSSVAPTATSYTWTSYPTGGTTVTTASNIAIYAPDVSFDGNYQLDIEDMNGCKNSVGSYVNVKYTPIIAAASTATICSGNAISLSAYGYLNSGMALGGNLMHWTGPNTYTATGPVKTIPNASPVNSGNYVVSATLNGCMGKDSVHITVNPLPVVIASNNSPVCTGDTLKLSGMPNNLSYNWSVPSGFNSSSQNLILTNATPVNAGSYTLTGTDANGCFAKSITTVTINALPVVGITNTNATVCEGSAINLNAATVAGATYQWSGPAGYTASTPSVNITNAAISHSGTYTLTVTNSNGCKSFATTNVTVNYTPVLSASATNSVVCIGGSVGLQANAYTSNGFVINGGSIHWTGPNAYSATGNTPIISNATTGMAGTYTVTVMHGACSVTQTVSILVNNAAPGLTVTSNSPVCPGSAITLSVNPVSGATYNWSGPNGFSSIVQNPVISNSTTQMSGLYTVIVSAGTCSATASASIVVTNMAVIVPTANSPVCLGAAVNLNAPLISGASYTWSGPAGFTSAVQNPTVANASLAMSGVYSVTATFGSCSSTGTVNVAVFDPAAVSLNISGTNTLCAGSTLALQASDVAGATYLWHGPDGYTSGVQNPVINNATASMSGSYVVVVNFACGSAKDSIEVKVMDCDTATIEGISVPQGFSPNGDGVNDLFVIKGIENYGKNTITIFNRWGVEIYTASPYANTWNGKAQKRITLSGDELPVGTYFYILDPGDGSKVLKGYIYLTR